MDVFLGRNYVSSPRTLKPKKPKKTFKNLKKILKKRSYNVASVVAYVLQKHLL